MRPVEAMEALAQLVDILRPAGTIGEIDEEDDHD